jgi:ATP-dependent Clp protease ATP-binding subunit ClpA
VRIEEPSADEAVAILLALRAAVEWSVRYLPDFRLPVKALDLVDQASAAVRFAKLSPGSG